MSDPEARMCLILWNDTIMWKYVSSDLIANKKPNVLDRYWIINIVAKIIFDIVASLTPSPPLVWRFCSGWMNPPTPTPSSMNES